MLRNVPALCELYETRGIIQRFEIRRRKSIVQIMQVAPKRPEPSEAGESGKVLQFPLRRAGRHLPQSSFDSDTESSDDFARFETDPDDAPVDYRRRMLMNVIAIAVVTVLISAGVWIADTIAAIEQDQDCLLQGRTDCALIDGHKLLWP